MARAQVWRSDNRTALRLDVRVSAALREVGSTQRFDVDVKDLSITGFRCETSFTLAIGQLVQLRLPSLAPLEAIVVRRDGFVYGCEFDRPLHMAVFDHIAARHRQF